jgi:hypothetical protein
MIKKYTQKGMTSHTINDVTRTLVYAIEDVMCDVITLHV